MANAATFEFINGLAAAGDGSLFVADGSGSIRRIAPDGRIRRFAGTGVFGYSGDGGPASAAQIFLSAPAGMTLAEDGTLIFVDLANYRLRRVSPDGVISTVAGYGFSYYGGNGYPAAETPLEYPENPAVGPDGSIFFDEQDIEIVRCIRPSGSPFGPDELMVASKDGMEVHFFDANGKHRRTVSALTGVVLLEFDYDSSGRLSTVTDVDGRVTRIERSGSRATAIIAPTGERTTLEHDGEGNLARVTSPADENFTMQYHAGGLLARFENPRGFASTFEYDARGKLIRDSNAAGGSVTISRGGDGSDSTVTFTTPGGRSTFLTTRHIDDERLEREKKDAAGLITRAVDLGGSARQVTYPDGTTIESGQDPDPRFGMQSAVTYATISTGSIQSDASTWRDVTLADPKNPLSLVRMSEEISVGGVDTLVEFEAASRSVTTTSSLGRSVRAYLNGKGRTERVVIPGLADTLYTYDARGLVTEVTRGARTTRYGYDGLERLESITDALGREVRFEYDLAGRVTKQVLPGAREVLFRHDRNSNLLGLTPPGRSEHGFEFDERDRNSAYEPPPLATGATPTNYSWSADDELLEVARPGGDRIELGYDAAGRLESLTHSLGALGYRYDAAGRLAGIDATGTTLDYSWDGGLITETEWSGEFDARVGFEWDGAMRVRRVTVNGGAGIDYGYDSDGLIEWIDFMHLSRDPGNGLVTGTTIGVVEDAWTYNEYGEVSGYVAKAGGSPIFAVAYTRDGAGRISVKRETIQGVTTTYEYRYDTPGRLAEVLVDGAVSAHYEYDANGNRTLRTTGAGSETATCDEQDRVVSVGGATFTYTPNGELRTRVDATGTTTYTYDALGNLTKAVLPDGKVVDYVIDGQSRRVGVKVDGEVRRGFAYDGQLSIAAELDANGTLVSRFDGGLVMRGGVTYRIISDHLGSPRLVVDTSTGAVVQRMDYDEFGNVTADTNPGFQPFGFAGGLYDRDTGLTRFGARDYDSTTGRWTAKDPIGFGGGDTNLYGYVMNDPVNLIDPMGTDGYDTAASISAGVGDALLFGFGDELRGWTDRQFGLNGGALVDECSTEYTAAYWTTTIASLVAGGGRVAYSLGAKSIGLAARERAAVEGVEAAGRWGVNARNALKLRWRFGTFPNTNMPTYEQLLATKSAERVLSGVGRTRQWINNLGRYGAASGTSSAAGGSCGCQ